MTLSLIQRVADPDVLEAFNLLQGLCATLGDLHDPLTDLLTYLCTELVICY